MDECKPAKDGFYRVLLDYGVITGAYFSTDTGWDISARGHVVFWGEMPKPWEDV